MTSEEKAYILLHRHEAVERLALQRAPRGVDHKLCLQQIKGWQVACRKLPLWAQAEDILYPPALSMEQCSSQSAALYKRTLAERLAGDRRVMMDLTGGMGVDFWAMAPLFAEAHYVEQLPHLCLMARHNLPLLGVGHAIIHEGECTDLLQANGLPSHADLIFIDPARRDANGRRTVWLEHCTPDITRLLPLLLKRTPCLVVKLSPMLDIARTLTQLQGHVCEVHTVCLEGECRELLVVVRAAACSEVNYHCVELGRKGYAFTGRPTGGHAPLAEGPEEYLYEPGAGLLKANIQDEVCRRWPLHKLHPNSHLYTGRSPMVTDFPGRIFRIQGMYNFSKQDIKHLQAAIPQANLTVRNFPATTEELRRRLKLKDGGEDYLFATTLAAGNRVLIHCRK